MASEIKLPELGENLESGEVLDVKVAEGDTVTEGQTLLELEAEKSTVEVPSPQAGKLARLLVKKGDQIKVGQTICVIEGPSGQNGGAKAAPARTAETTKTPPAEPDSPPSTKRAEIAEPAPEEAQEVREKAQQDAPARPTAAPAHEETPPKTDGDRARPAPPVKQPQAPAMPAARPSGNAVETVPAGPATRRLARELGVDLNQVQGSGRGGRVTEEDVKSYVRQLASGVAAHGFSVQAPPLPDFERWGPVERKPLEAIRRRTAEQMSLAWNVIPHVTQHDEADITDLDAFRRQQEGTGPRLTVTAFALRAAANALKQFPQFNSSIDLAGGQLILKRYYHIGVAVDTERGLLVPVIRDVDKKSVRELAQELADMAERARQRKLSADEMRGATFTITNLGSIGGTGFSPIVNYPQVAILGLSRARLQPVIRDGQVVPRLVLPVSLSYDHRVIDGADAARFTRRLAEMFENPLLMLL
jgi:pyruvate dehydrogenase E2 component (dihydrolipoamide acetyltransferase)